MGGRGAVFENKNYSATISREEKKIYKNVIESAVCIDKKGNVIFSESSGATNYV